MIDTSTSQRDQAKGPNASRSTVRHGKPAYPVQYPCLVSYYKCMA